MPISDPYRQNILNQYMARQYVMPMAQQAYQAQQAYTQLKESLPFTLQEMQGMFGNYLPDPMQYGGYNDQYWQAAGAKRITDVDPLLAGHQFMVDYGGDQRFSGNVRYFNQPWEYSKDPYNTVRAIENIDKTPGLLGTGPYILPTNKADYASWNTSEGNLGGSFGASPNKISEFGGYKGEQVKYPVGYWVYTGEGSPQKTSAAWARGDEQSYPNWRYISAIDPNIDISKIPTQYRAQYSTPYVVSGEGDSVETFIAYDYRDPRTVGPGIYRDPAGRERTLMPSAAGYAPSKGAFDYGHGGVQGWIDRNITPNMNAIASGLFTLATAGLGGIAGGGAGIMGGIAAPSTMGAALGGGLGGAVTGGATTGQRTNDLWRILAGAAAGGLGGAAGGFAGAGGLSGLGSLGKVGYGAGVGAGAGTLGGYAATGDWNTALRSGLIGGVTGGVAAGLAPAQRNLYNSLVGQGVNPTTANTIARLAAYGANYGVRTGLQGIAPSSPTNRLPRSQYNRIPGRR